MDPALPLRPLPLRGQPSFSRRALLRGAAGLSCLLVAACAPPPRPSSAAKFPASTDRPTAFFDDGSDFAS